MSFRDNLPSTADVTSAASSAATQAADVGMQASALVSAKASEAANAARGPLSESIAYVSQASNSALGLG